MSNSRSPSQLIVFGDSLSDSGNSLALTLGAIPPAPYYLGRFSNGAVAVEYLAAELGFTLNPYYDDNAGNNFAVGGARTGTDNSNNDDIAPFLPGVTLPGVTNQIDDFVSSLDGDSADSNALYFVLAGANDFFDYLGGGMPADPAQLIEQGITNLAEGVARLTDLGAENVIVSNIPSLGRLPFSANFRDEATAISLAYNGGLSLALDNLGVSDDSLATNLLEVDLFTFNETITANPAEFGLTNVTEPFLLSGLPLPSDPSDTTGFLFWDLFHPTTEVHAIFADTIAQIISGAIPQPTFNQIIGTAKPDLLFATQAADNIDGLAGNDLIVGWDGDDRLEGWAGDDFLLGNQGNDIMHGGDDRDYVWGGRGDDLLFGGNGNDQLLGGTGKDIIIGGSDNDYVWGGKEADYLLGGAGEDTLWGNQDNDTLNGGAGNDIVRGGAGEDMLDGGMGDDILFGGDGADIFELTPDFGTEHIADFQVNSDRLMLSSGLTFNDLSLAGDKILLADTETTLAIISGLDTTTLTESDFIVT